MTNSLSYRLNPCGFQTAQSPLPQENKGNSTYQLKKDANIEKKKVQETAQNTIDQDNLKTNLLVKNLSKKQICKIPPSSSSSTQNASPNWLFLVLQKTFSRAQSCLSDTSGFISSFGKAAFFNLTKQSSKTSLFSLEDDKDDWNPTTKEGALVIFNLSWNKLDQKQLDAVKIQMIERLQKKSAKLTSRDLTSIIEKTIKDIESAYTLLSKELEKKQPSKKLNYTGLDSTVGNFAKASAPDFSSMTQPISLGDISDAVDKKDGDDGAGKNPTFESRPV